MSERLFLLTVGYGGPDGIFTSAESAAAYFVAHYPDLSELDFADHEVLLESFPVDMGTGQAEFVALDFTDDLAVAVKTLKAAP